MMTSLHHKPPFNSPSSTQTLPPYPPLPTKEIDPPPASSQSTVITPTTQPPLYIQFNTPLQSTPAEILTELATTLDNASIPQDSISSTLFSWAFSSIKITDEKESFITILDPSLAPCIVTIICQAFDISLPTITYALPPYPTTSDIDTTPEPSSLVPRNCRVKTCPFYNGGMNIFHNTPEGLLNAQHHGLRQHHDILTSLSDPLLNNIGWTRCCLPCNHIFLSPTDLLNHRSECITYSTHNTTTPSTFDPTTSSQWQWAPLFAMCTDSHKSDLSNVISSSPETNPSSLFPHGLPMVHGIEAQ